jgi:hypothetical protein
VIRRLFSEEGFENAFAILSGDPWPFILYRELQFGVVRDPSRDTNGGRWWRIFDRVVDQVGEYALHLTRIHPN